MLPDMVIMTDESLHGGYWVAGTDSNKAHMLKVLSPAHEPNTSLLLHHSIGFWRLGVRLPNTPWS